MTRSMLFRKLPARALALALGLGAVRSAEAQTPAAPDDAWHFVVAPNLMGATLDGTALVKGQPLDIDVSSSQIFDHMDYGAMGLAAARKGDWGIVGDAVWVKLRVDNPMPPATFAPTIGLVSVAGVRRLSPYADATLGARWNHLGARIDLKAPAPIGLERTRDWVDPVVGVVLRTPADKRFHASLIADIGGFGVGSDITWQVFPTAGVRFASWASLEAGWRFLSTDYKTGKGSDRFEYGMLYQGPVVGLAFRF